MLTERELAALRVLLVLPLTTRDVVRKVGGAATYDSEHARLRRLEDRWFVRRIEGRPCKWELTASGREALA